MMLFGLFVLRLGADPYDGEVAPPSRLADRPHVDHVAMGCDDFEQVTSVDAHASMLTAAKASCQEQSMAACVVAGTCGRLVARGQMPATGGDVDDPQDNGGFRPPYFSFQTFWNYLIELAARPLPPRIDRSMMNSKSGTDQANLFSALKAFQLIDADQRVEERLTSLAVADEAARKAALGDLVRAFYPDQIAVSEQNGTEAQLNESFSDGFQLTSADTRRKAVTFFLHAARMAEIPLSPHFPATRSGSGAPGVPKTKKAASRKKVAADETKPPATTAAGSAHQVVVATFGRAGTVTMTVDVRWLDLPDDTFTRLRQLIKDIEALGSADGDVAAKETANS